MKNFSDSYVIGKPYASERTGLQGSYQTTNWFDRNGHPTGGETNGCGNTSAWTGKTHGEYRAAMDEIRKEHEYRDE